MENVGKLGTVPYECVGCGCLQQACTMRIAGWNMVRQWPIQLLDVGLKVAMEYVKVLDTYM
jgi:hypothetical protein